MLQTVDEKVINAWKHFYRSLDNVDVVIPFAPDISNFVTKSDALPESARRAFNRVISGIKTVALLYQYQREKDEYGRIIAKMSDYAIAYQLMKDAFLEVVGQRKRYTDRRIQIIEKHTMIAPKYLAKGAGVSGSAISQWITPMVKKKVLMWVDPDGGAFPDDKSLEKAKRSGKAYIKVSQFNRLPTPYELTGNPDWDIEGELYRQYDFGFESGTDTDVLELDESDRSSSFFNTFHGSNEGENKKETEDSTEGVNALSSIPHKDVMKMVEELKENQKECDPNDPETVNLFDEFNSIFQKNKVCTKN